MEIAGLPLHPLVVHAAVVFVPLAVLVTIAFAVAPRLRWLTRWPAVVLTVVALATVRLAQLSGTAFLEAQPALAQLVQEHQARAELLGNVTMPVMTVVVLLAAWALGGPSALVSGRGARETRHPLAGRVLPVLLVVVSLAATLGVVLTGDAGSRAVWG